jgi:ketosteroid isomerase-like protein
MPLTLERTDIEKVRLLDQRRVKAAAASDVEALASLLDDELVYITSSGVIFNKQQYLNALRTNRLTYSEDFNVRPTEYRVLNGFIILVGVMLGHAQLNGEQQVFHCRCLSAWRQQGDDWRMVLWQSSPGSIADATTSAEIPNGY